MRRSLTNRMLSPIGTSLFPRILYPIVRQSVPQNRQANEKSCKAHTLSFLAQITFIYAKSIRLIGFNTLKH